ncbi:MAG: PD40 domain-containing protein [Anaerolineae bacterium]|nr:PD40 domain-containing protein [Anaerolineae bacterium]
MRNPYVTDRPLTGQDLYYGREGAFARLNTALGSGERLFVLYAPRYAGKTSFLNQLSLRFQRRVVRRIEWTALDPRHDDPLGRLLFGVARAFGLGDPDWGDGPIDGDQARRYLQALFSAQEPRLHLLCFDTIPGAAFEDQEAWESALRVLGSALDRGSSLAILLSVESAPGQYIVPDVLCGCHRIELEPLQERETEDLLTLPVRGRLSYDHDSIRYVQRLTGGEPYLVQLFGEMLFDRRIALGWAGRPEAEEVAQALVSSGVAPFGEMWSACGPTAQIVLSVLAERRGASELGSASDVALYLRQLQTEMPAEDLDEGLKELVQREILDRMGGEIYRFRSDLFRGWIKANKSTAQTFRDNRRYAQQRLERIALPRSRHVDWLGLLLWGVAGLLVAAIAWVWRSRETTIISTGKPTVAALVAHEPSPEPTPAVPTPQRGVAPGHIVYMGKERVEDKWSIYAMRSDGSDPVRLTDSGANDTSPAWAPDGRRIVFVSDRDGNREIYVMNADGNQQLNVTNHAAEDWTPSWSPNGTQIAFASFRDGNWELYLANADGSDPQRLTQNQAADYSPRFSPDGRRLVFVSDRDGNLEIYVMGVDGSDQTRVTEHEATDQNPVWSLDGERILWESYRENNMEIFAARLDGTELGPLSRDAYADDHGPTWSPWGKRIAYYSNRDHGWDIYTFDLETGERANLTLSAMLEQAPHWGP